MSTTLTTNLSLNKMDKGDLGWWSLWNTNADLIDALFSSATRNSRSILFYNASSQFDWDSRLLFNSSGTLVLGHTSAIGSTHRLFVRDGGSTEGASTPFTNRGWVAAFSNVNNDTSEGGVLIVTLDSTGVNTYILECGASFSGTYAACFQVKGNGQVLVPKSGLVVGNATGGSKGIGTINTANDVYKNDMAYTSPDAIFEKYYTGKVIKYADSPHANYPGLLPIDKLREYTRQNWRLPRIDDEPSGIFTRSDIALEKIEELFLYLFETQDKIGSLVSRLDKLEEIL